MTGIEADTGLGAHREQIDAIDEQIIDLLNQRRRHVLAIGAIKCARGQYVHDYVRENSVLAHIQEVNTGPMDDEEVTALYVRLLEMNRRVQRGTYSADHGLTQVPVCYARGRGW